MCSKTLCTIWPYTQYTVCPIDLYTGQIRSNTTVGGYSKSLEEAESAATTNNILLTCKSDRGTYNYENKTRVGFSASWQAEKLFLCAGGFCLWLGWTQARFVTRQSSIRGDK